MIDGEGKRDKLPQTLRLDEDARASRKTRVAPKGGFERASETSRMAAEALDRVDVSAQEGRVLAALRSRAVPRSKRSKKGPALLLPEQGGGMTDKEIEAHAGLSHESASARRRGLVLKGFVKDSGFVRRTPSGRWASVWVLGAQDKIEAGGPNKHARRPTNAEILLAISLIETSVAFNPHFERKLLAWLRRIATEGASP